MASVTFQEEKCKGCGLCVTFCPKHILQMAPVRINAKAITRRSASTRASASAARAVRACAPMSSSRWKSKEGVQPWQRY